MGHPIRADRPGAVFHVVNRGVARRTILDNDEERRFFLSLLARGARRGRLRLHAYALMTNHYHLLLTSEGDLSEFMQWAMSRFVRRFNRRRERDGPLFRGRFRARRVLAETDFRNVVRYIDRNPVEAGLATTPEAYASGSARHYCRGTDRPRWLHRVEVEAMAARLAGGNIAADSYRRAFHDGPASFAWCVERRLEVEPDERDPLVQLSRIGGEPSGLSAWLRDDASAPAWVRRPPLCAPSDVLAAVGAIPREGLTPRDGRHGDPWAPMLCGLLRAACGLSYREVASAARVSETAARLRCTRHVEAIVRPGPYAARAGEVLAGALRVIA